MQIEEKQCALTFLDNEDFAIAVVNDIGVSRAAIYQ